MSTEGNWKRWAPWRRVAGLSGATGLRVLQKWMLDSRGLGVSSKVGVCSMAGVSEEVGRDGLQMFMGDMSEAVTNRVGVLSSRILGGLRILPAEAGPPHMDHMLLSSAFNSCD